MHEPDPVEADKAVRKTGSWMIVGGWGLAILLLTLLFGGFLDRKRNPNTLRVVEGQSGSLVLEGNEIGVYLASGYLNDVPVEYILDTGASLVAVPADLAAAAGMQRGRQIVLDTANGRARGWQSVAQSIEIGPLRLQGVQAVIMENLSGEILLGMSALKGLQFSQVDGRLEIRAY